MKKFKLININRDKPIYFNINEEITTSFYMSDYQQVIRWDNEVAYNIIKTDYPLPKCLPQRISLNEMEIGDMIQHNKFNNDFLIRVD